MKDEVRFRHVRWTSEPSAVSKRAIGFLARTRCSSDSAAPPRCSALCSPCSEPPLISPCRSHPPRCSVPYVRGSRPAEYAPASRTTMCSAEKQQILQFSLATKSASMPYIPPQRASPRMELSPMDPLYLSLSVSRPRSLSPSITLSSSVPLSLSRYTSLSPRMELSQINTPPPPTLGLGPLRESIVYSGVGTRSEGFDTKPLIFSDCTLSDENHPQKTLHTSVGI
jgi:hypothetical protein